jgi:glycosyltransferase involved in cell wall biosynthesis
MSFLKPKSISLVYEKNDIHLKRLISSLQNYFKLHLYQESEVKSTINSDNVIYLPLDISSEFFGFVGPEVKVTGLSLGYDINLFNADSKKGRQLSRNLSLTDQVIVDCSHSRHVLTSALSFSRPVFEIPYGLDFSLFGNPIDISASRSDFLVTRNWNEISNNELILCASEHFPETRFNFVGKFLKERLGDTHNTRSNVEFIDGFSERELHHYLGTNAFYASASKSDGSSVSLLEAMASGRICLASDFPSNQEWIEVGVSGFLFENGNLESLKYEISRMLKLTPSERGRISQAARDIVKRDADWRLNLPKLVEFLR